MIHPGVLPVIADAAKEYVSESANLNRQLFITTHSPSLLDLFDPSSIIWVSFENGVTECGRIAERQLKLIKDELFSPGEILVSEGFFS
jgi:predicted ATPase